MTKRKRCFLNKPVFDQHALREKVERVFMFKKIIVLFAMAWSIIAMGEVSVVAVTAQQRYPWNGKVDIIITFTGTEEESGNYRYFITAINSDTGVAIPIEHIEQVGQSSASNGIWTKHYVWDADVDFGKVKLNALAITVDVKALGGVQLWEGGPYFAECNVGAEKPEAYGYYFWWSDTVGYAREGGTVIKGSYGGYSCTDIVWVSSTGEHMSASPFSWSSCPLSQKSYWDLFSAGYIDASGNLTSEYDAATAHLGAPWRMPTEAEFSAMVNNCDMTWTSHNGVAGFCVRGRGDYSTKSIFLPAAGHGADLRLNQIGEVGVYWLSTADDSINACSSGLFTFDLYYSHLIGGGRYGALSVRPVRGSAK